MQIFKIFLIIGLCAILNNVAAQDTLQLHQSQISIAQKMEEAKNQETDSLKKYMMDVITSDFGGLLYYDAAFDYNFYMLKNVSSVYSNDNKLRILTWVLPLNDGTHQYYGFVLYRESPTDGVMITPLTDMSEQTPNPQNANMQANNWYGAIYYELQQVGNKKSKIYGAAGWDGGDLFTNRKVLEQITINSDGIPIFGGTFKSEESDGLKRLIFEFTKKAGMTLRYDQKLKMFVADHLSAPPQFRGNKRFYGPDMSFDGYVFDYDRWFYEPDLDVKNK